MKQLQRFANSLVVRLTVLGLFLVVLGTAGRLLVLSHFLGQDVLAQSGVQLMALSDYAAAQTGNHFELRRAALERLAARLPDHLEPASQPLASALVSAQLAAFQASNDDFAVGLAVLGLNGQVLAATAPNLASRHAAVLTPALASEARQQGFAIGRPAAVGPDARVVLPMALAVPAADGRAAAVLVGLTALGSKGVVSALIDTHIGQSGALTLVLPQEGLSLGASGGVVALTPVAPPGMPGVAVGVNSAGVQALTATAPVPGSRWMVVAHQPTSEVLMPVRQLQNRTLLNSGLLLVVLMVVLVLLLRHVFKPLVLAAAQADRMTHGDLPLAHLPVVRNDEVGHLTAAFNRLLDKLSETQIALSEMAHHDTLTGLPNRKLLADVLMRALARADRNGTEVAVLFLDLDGFKLINDAHGHACGDDALRQVAQRLTGVMRQADTVARIGGDEFVALLSDLSAGDRAGVEQVAQKCLNAFVQPFDVKGNVCQLGVSVGIAMGPGTALADALMSAADTAMYLAKQAGKGQVVWAAEPQTPPAPVWMAPTG